LTSPRYIGPGFIGFGGLQTPAGSNPTPYTETEFADCVFGGPAEFSTAEFNLVDDNTGGKVFATDNDQVVYCVNLLHYMATKYPGAKIGIMFGYNILDTEAQAALVSLINYLKQEDTGHNIGVLGFDIEQTNVVTQSGWTPADFDNTLHTIGNIITAAGYDFANYYPGGYKGSEQSSFYWFDGPDASEPNANSFLAGNANTSVGVTQEGAAGQVFPDVGCGVNSKPRWTVNPYAANYSTPNCSDIPLCSKCGSNNYPDQVWPPSIVQALQYCGVINPAKNRKWNFLDFGFSSTGYGVANSTNEYVTFKGVSGIMTAQLFDHPLIQSTIASWKKANPTAFVNPKVLPGAK